jgi:hypothetical protein
MDSREIFETMLSSSSVGAAEAWALLGSCKAARSVGGAASLKELTAVALLSPTSTPLEELQYAVPFVCDLHPYVGGNTEFGGGPDPEYRWPNASAIPMGYVLTRDKLYPGRNSGYDEPSSWSEREAYTGADELTVPGFKLMSTREAEAEAAQAEAEAAEARYENDNSDSSSSYDDDDSSREDEGASSGAGAVTTSSSLSQLRCLLRRCPNVLSLRLLQPRPAFRGGARLHRRRARISRP